MASSGNFDTLSNLDNPTYDSTTNVPSQGGLKYTSSGNNQCTAQIPLTFKSYCEVRIVSISNYGGSLGFGLGSLNNVFFHGSVTFQTNYSSGYIYVQNGALSGGGSQDGNAGGTVSAGDIVMMAYDPDTFKWWVGKNGTWNSSGDPGAGSNPVYTGSATQFSQGKGNNSDIVWGAYTSSANGLTCVFNFGQDSTFGGLETAGNNSDGNGHGDFKYAPPTGFLANCAANMPIGTGIDPAGDDGEDKNPKKQFFMTEYAGNLTNRTITTENQADLILIRHTNYAQNWYVVDSNRGITNNYYTKLDTNAAEATFPQSNFQSVGATSVGISSGTWLNSTGANYQMWMWHCNGGTTTSDSSGDITVTRQTNDDSKFTIATWTGNGSSGSTIAHGLGVKPAMTWIKKRNATAAHNCWHQGYNNGDYDSFGELLGDAAWYANQGANGPYSAAPGTDFLTLTAYSQVNGSSNTYVGYFWADVEGMQKFGSYRGNGNANGPYIRTGFRPRMLFIKRTDSTGDWWVLDSHRNTHNPVDNYIPFNSNSAEATGIDVDFLANGFKIRSSSGDFNASQGDFVFGAWADVPFKYTNTF